MQDQDQKPGYRIQGHFYPYVPVDDWYNRDFVLAGEISRKPLQKLFGGEVDQLTLKLVMAAVAVWHVQEDLEMETVIRSLHRVKPSQLEEEGFTEAAGAADPNRDAAGGGEAPASGSSETSETSPEPTPEPSEPTSSGSPGSATGSPASTPGT